MGWRLAFFARGALAFIWLITPFVSRAFHRDWIVPLVGIIFLPFTTLVFIFATIYDGGVTDWDWFWIALALLFDLMTHVSGVTTYLQRIPAQTPLRE
jgi:hypothetical protein